MFCLSKNFECNTYKCCKYCSNIKECNQPCKDDPKKCGLFTDEELPPVINWISVDLKKWDTDKDKIREKALDEAYEKEGRIKPSNDLILPKTLEPFRDKIKDYYTDNNGQKFGRKKGSKTTWVILKDIYVSNRGKSKINEADLLALASKLRKVKLKDS